MEGVERSPRVRVIFSFFLGRELRPRRYSSVRGLEGLAVGSTMLFFPVPQPLAPKLKRVRWVVLRGMRKEVVVVLREVAVSVN